MQLNTSLAIDVFWYIRGNIKITRPHRQTSYNSSFQHNKQSFEQHATQHYTTQRNAAQRNKILHNATQHIQRNATQHNSTHPGLVTSLKQVFPSILWGCHDSSPSPIYIQNYLRSDLSLVQSLNSPFFPPLIGAEPGRTKEESRITCMRMLRTPPFLQVTLYSSFVRPGSAPIRGGKKGELRDWTKLSPGHIKPEIFETQLYFHR